MAAKESPRKGVDMEKVAELQSKMTPIYEMNTMSETIKDWFSSWRKKKRKRP